MTVVKIEEIRKGSIVEIQGKNVKIEWVHLDAHTFELYTPYAGYLAYPMTYITKVVKF